MNYKQLLNCLLTTVCLLGAVANVSAQDVIEPELIPGEEVVLQWNRVLAQTIATPGQQPATIRTHRPYAMMHLAMFDAVNSVDGSHTPYLTDMQNNRASIRAAAAYAAHGVLAATFPSRQAIYDAELSDSLVGISATPLGRGRDIGQAVAVRMLANRANDGWTVTPPAYVLPTTPGNWQPTPPANAAAIFTHYSGVTPFVMSQSTQFLPPPPPPLTSAEYAEELNEVRTLGAANSTVRTPFQTQTSQLWATGATTEVYLNNLARDLALSRNLSTPQTARLFALYYVAIHDALQTSFTAQYTYGRWRPLTAIRRADEDNNPATTPDPAWTSLLNAPATPAYSSNASSLTSSAASALELFFGRDDIEFQINFGGTPNVVRTYPSFSAMANEAARSRVFSGIHFHSDTVAGQIAGRNAANLTFRRILKPRCEGK